MNFCYNCGKPVLANDCFCAGCGVTLGKGEIYLETKSTHPQIQYGYLFTNIQVLSHKLNVTGKQVEDALHSFIYAKAESNIYYQLIDVSDYQPLLAKNKFSGKKITLTPVDTWQTHQQLLADQYKYDQERNEKEITYLFIIGGHDVIPMPCINHYFPAKDTDIETDLPYSYLYGSETKSCMEDGSLFSRMPMLYTGRLPLPKDTTWEYLQNYLQRTVRVSNDGFLLSCIYGQSDPNWKMVSATVLKELYDSGLMFQYEEERSGSCYKSIILTPEVSVNSIGQYFIPTAMLYYFNMHGSNAPLSPGFSGEQLKIPGKENEPAINGISPSQWSETQQANIVVTEACYGARFINCSIRDSMLLSAFANNTVLYIGSSRISLGKVDNQGTGNTQIINNADIIARMFIGGMMRYGFSAAHSLHIAKCNVFEETRRNYETDNNHSLTTAERDLNALKAILPNLLTVTEFNLFGDPSLTFKIAGAENWAVKAKNQDINPKSTILPPNLNICCHTKKIYDASANSLLNQIRQLVDTTIADINKKITDHLYIYYGISPRPLKGIFETDTGISKSYLYQYEEEGISQIWVTLDSKNQIIEVATTK